MYAQQPSFNCGTVITVYANRVTAMAQYITPAQQALHNALVAGVQPAGMPATARPVSGTVNYTTALQAFAACPATRAAYKAAYRLAAPAFAAWFNVQLYALLQAGLIGAANGVAGPLARVTTNWQGLGLYKPAVRTYRQPAPCNGVSLRNALAAKGYNGATLKLAMQLAYRRAMAQPGASVLNLMGAANG